MKILVMIFQVILLAQMSASVFASSAKCEVYRGYVCNKMEYSIPFGQTQEAMDKEIVTLVNSESYKYVACKEYFKHLLCIYNYQECRLPKQGATFKVVVPPCRKTCKDALDSICLKTLRPGSLLQKWVKKKMVCSDYPLNGASLCEVFDLQRNQDILEYSCMYENTNRSDMKNVVTASITSPLQAYEKPLDIKHAVKKILQRHFPTKLPADTKCHTQNCRISDFLHGRSIQYLPNFRADETLKQFRVPVYCESPSTKVKIFPFISKQPLYTPDKYLTLKEVSYAIVDDGNNVQLAAYGCFDICFEGNFKYNIVQEDQGVTVYTAINNKPIAMKWVEIFFQSSSMHEDMKFILQVFSFIPSLVFNNLKWTTLWKNKQKVNLLQDTRTSTVLSFPKKNVNEKPKEKNVTLEQSEVLILSRSKFWSVFLEITELDLIGFAKSVLHPDIVTLGLKPFIERFGLNELLQIDLIQYFMKTTGDFTTDIPRSPHLDKAKVVMFLRQTKYHVMAKIFGKVSPTSKHKPNWLDASPFTLTFSSYLNKKRIWEQEIYLEFENQQVNCQPTHKDWTNFNKVIDSLKDWQKCSCRVGRTVEKVIKCETCCNLNEDRVTSIKVYNIRHLQLSMNITLRNQATETTHNFRDVNIELLKTLTDVLDDPESGSGSAPIFCIKNCAEAIY